MSETDLTNVIKISQGHTGGGHMETEAMAGGLQPLGAEGNGKRLPH